MNCNFSEMLSTAAISTPGVKQTFLNVMALLKAKREQNLTNGMICDSEGGSGTDEELNKTVFEVENPPFSVVLLILLLFICSNIIFVL